MEILYALEVTVKVFNATFNNNLVISWRSVLLVEETGENHRPTANHWQTNYQKTPTFLLLRN